jgi:delta-1-pyrroline-5-carboxylate synthetase
MVLSGVDLDAIRSVTSKEYGPAVGTRRTLFATPGSELERQAVKEMEDARSKGGESVSEARDQARRLQALPHSERRAILYAVADALEAEKEGLLAANRIDLDNAERDGTELQLVRRLKLTDAKLRTLSSGIRQIADQPDPLGVVRAKRELADGLVLSQITVPIGLLMIIFESRPDSMPQISALALASGNGLLLKGGKEAARSNEAIHKVIGDAIEKGSGGKITRDIIALVTSRGQVADMLKLDDVVDLVIPRGSNALVSYIKANTRIPVLGHADGVCHVYVDKSAKDAALVSKLVVDAKTDYPSACNAMESLLLHRDTLAANSAGNIAMSVLMSLRAAGVKCLGGPRAMKAGLCDVAAEEMKCEYGDLRCMVEIVENMDEAVDWIHEYGSGHTESIVCAEDDAAGEEFLQRVDAACVFKNASTRFADGYRFGLGAEVGISTGRIHARGPVGVEGLLTVKWQLRSSGLDTVAEYGGDNPQKVYTHKDL